VAGPVEHERAVAAFARCADADDVEPAVPQMHRGTSREPADARRVEHLDADADARRRLRIDALTNRLRCARRGSAQRETDSSDSDQQRYSYGSAENQATSFHRETVSG
jgi:hypothetical protein